MLKEIQTKYYHLSVFTFLTHTYVERSLHVDKAGMIRNRKDAREIGADSCHIKEYSTKGYLLYVIHYRFMLQVQAFWRAFLFAVEYVFLRFFEVLVGHLHPPFTENLQTF